MSNENKGLWLGLLAVFLFSLTLPATRYVVADLNPIFIGLGRAVLASLFAAMLLLVTRQKIPNKTQFVQLAIVALGVILGFPVLTAFAMQTVPASHGGVVLALLPLAMALVGVLFAHERPSFGFWLVSFVGSVLVLIFSLYDTQGTLLWGDFLILLAVISAAIGYGIGGKLAQQLGGWQVICWALVIALPFIIVPAYLNAPTDITHFSISKWASFLYLALVSQLSGFFIWYKALSLGGIARVSQTQLVQPFFTLIAAALLLDETLNIMTIIFAMLVISTVYIGKKMPIKQVDKKVTY